MSAAQIQDRRINAGTSAKATTAQFNGQFSDYKKHIFTFTPCSYANNFGFICAGFPHIHL